MVRARRVTDQASPDLTALLANLVQQQTAMAQQQAALLQLHTETVQLQRLLAERALGITTPVSTAVGQPETPPVATSAATEPPLALQASPVPAGGSEESPAAPSAAPSATRTDNGIATMASHAARYYQARPAHAPPKLAPVQPLDLELMRRLHEMRDTGDMILQFGPHKGSTLADLVIHDPDYVRELALRARRPEVRVAATRLVEALDAAAAHQPRLTRGAGRRLRQTA